MRAEGEAEEHLRSTDLVWTILQPNVFVDVWFPAVLGPALAGQPVTLVGQGQRRHSFVAAHDVADYAVSALTTDLADRETLVIGGPQPLSWSEVIAMFEQEVGHPVEVDHLAPGDQVPHLPAAMAELLAFMDTYESPVDMTHLSRRHANLPDAGLDPDRRPGREQQADADERLIRPAEVDRRAPRSASGALRPGLEAGRLHGEVSLGEFSVQPPDDRPDRPAHHDSELDPGATVG